MDIVAITPCGPIDARMRPPGSKSITNRALLCAALAEGRSLLSGALASEDTAVMIESLGRLGVAVAHRPQEAEIEVAGCGGRFPAREARLYLSNSGTSIRFLTAAVTLGFGQYVLDGSQRMRQRPIRDLADALRQLGAHVTCEANGCPPVTVVADGLPGGATTVAGSISSQYLSALLLAAPYARERVELHVEGELVSKPYVAMTAAVMQAFGAPVTNEAYRRLTVPPTRYRGCTYAIEPDASAASYFFAAAAITGGRVTVDGLSRASLQGDVAFCECLAAMGCEVAYAADSIAVAGRRLHGVDVDMNAISDTAQTLAVVALFAEGPTTIRGIGHNRHKETDRIADLARELRKLGAEVDEHEDGLRVSPVRLQPAAIDTYNDHRMAMSLSLAGLRVPGVWIRDPRCVEKTYPNYFSDLEQVTRTAVQQP